MNHHHQQTHLTDDLNTRLVTAGAILTVAGAALACTGMALAGFAVFSAGRQMIHRMEVAPGRLAAVKWQQAKQASRAGVQAWQAYDGGLPSSSSGAA